MDPDCATVGIRIQQNFQTEVKPGSGSRLPVNPDLQLWLIQFSLLQVEWAMSLRICHRGVSPSSEATTGGCLAIFGDSRLENLYYWTFEHAFSGFKIWEIYFVRKARYLKLNGSFVG